jgi:hypothetical protein
MRGRLFSYLVVFFLFWLGAISTILSPSPCLGSESGEELATFSLEADQQALGEVLQQISKTTGYEITIDPEYAKLPITASLKNVTVEEALRRILGKLSRYMVIDEAAKKISVRIVDAGVKKTTAIGSQEKSNPLDQEMIPPQEPGEQGITQRELEEINKKQANIDRGDLEVIPPQEPGGRGVTLKELEEINKSQANINRGDLEVIPPQELGGRGVTLKELEEINKSQANIDRKDLEGISPERRRGILDDSEGNRKP